MQSLFFEIIFIRYFIVNSYYMKITEVTTYFKFLKHHATIVDPISHNAYVWLANRIILWEITAGSSKLHRRERKE